MVKGEWRRRRRERSLKKEGKKLRESKPILVLLALPVALRYL
jgi:hypothetical protein